MLSLHTGKVITRDQFKVLPMPTSVIAILDRIAAADGIPITRMTTGVPTDSIRDFDSATSYLPTTITPPNYTEEDPTLLSCIWRERGLSYSLPTKPGSTRLLRCTDPARRGVYLQIHTISATTSPDPTHTLLTLSQHLLRLGVRVRSGVTGRGAEQTQVPTTMILGVTEMGAGVTWIILGVTTQPGRRQMRKPTRAAPARCAPTGVLPERRNRRRPDEQGDHGSSGVEGRDGDEHYSEGGDTDARENAERAIMKELNQMLTKRVWTPVDGKKLTAEHRSQIIRSSMILKKKYLASGEFEKLKARLVAGGDQQDKDLYDDLSAPTVSTSSVFTILSIAAHEGWKASVVDIGGAFLNAEMKTGLLVHMRLDRTMSDLLVRLQPSYKKYQAAKGCIVVLLNRALYGCVESAASLYENLRDTMSSLGYERNPHDICVFNKRGKQGLQCTATVHVDDLQITSVDESMIESLAEGLRLRYGEINKSNGTTLNYLGMVLDFTHPRETRVTMKGFVDDMLKSSGATGGARIPATEGLIEARATAIVCTERRRKDFHSTVAKMLYLARSTRPECLTAVAYLATRVTKCTEDDWDKLTRLLRYVNDSKERGIVLRPGKQGIKVRVLIDASSGVHADGKSHTGGCIVVGETGAVHCESAKQQIVISPQPRRS
jgi:Reverse transcriptase (RNA-dependent DNA polymerase)